MKEHRDCGGCRHHRLMRVRRNGADKRAWICDGDLSEYEGLETAYNDTCGAWEARED